MKRQAMTYRNTEERIQFERQQFMVLCRAFFPDCTFCPEICGGDCILVQVFTKDVSELVYFANYDTPSDYDVYYYQKSGDTDTEQNTRASNLDKLAAIIKKILNGKGNAK